MTRPDYTNEAQQRILRTLVLLAGNEFLGLAPSQIAKSIGTNPSNVTRDLANLKTAGLAEEMDGLGTWRLGPKVVQIALAFSEQSSRMGERVAEIQNRYTRLP